MIDISEFIKHLNKNGIEFYTGVPDSYLNGFCNYILHEFPEHNVIAANEGNAIGIAAGHYIATKQIPLVYMQNSGLGNAVNPLASLADSAVYAIPMILLIGWRGQPGTNDWEQHRRQGNITIPILESLGIEYEILTAETDANAMINKLCARAKIERKAVAIIVTKGIFSGEKSENIDENYQLSRKEAIEIILDTLPKDTVFSATTGRMTRELFYLREKRKEGHERDYLNVGSMGHVSSVALGMALARPDRLFAVLDGDAATIMHMGALTMASKLEVPNLLHIVLNNGVHESVGSQPSAGFEINFTQIAEGCGYCTMGEPVISKEQLINACKKLMKKNQAGFIDVRIHKGMNTVLPPLCINHRETIDGLSMELVR